MKVKSIVDQLHKIAEAVSSKRPAKNKLESAVKAMQLYLGGVDRTRTKDAQRLYNRINKLIVDITKTTGMDHEDVWSQLEKEARKRGIITPTPGKDF